MVKLCAIYNVWDDWDLLSASIDNIFQLVDGIIVVYSRRSNYGELSDPGDVVFPGNVELFQREPMYSHPSHSETDKRNYGLNIARDQGYTHFVMMDADEFYDPKEFYEAREVFEADHDLNGMVVQCQTYFKSPTLTIGLDTTLVPFIHKITPTIKHEFNRNYPFAWIDGHIRIDPTRSLNINDGIGFRDIRMHHMSWIRKDFEKKIRNSTARHNLERSTIREDLRLAKEGYFVKFYGKSLVRAQVDFNIPEFNVSDH